MWGGGAIGTLLMYKQTEIYYFIRFIFNLKHDVILLFRQFHMLNTYLHFMSVIKRNSYTYIFRAFLFDFEINARNTKIRGRNTLNLSFQKIFRSIRFPHIKQPPRSRSLLHFFLFYSRSNKVNFREKAINCIFM